MKEKNSRREFIKTASIVGVGAILFSNCDDVADVLTGNDVVLDPETGEYQRLGDFDLIEHIGTDPAWIYYVYEITESDIASPKTIFDTFNHILEEHDIPIKKVGFANIKLEDGTRATPWGQQRWKRTPRVGDAIIVSATRTDKSVRENTREMQEQIDREEQEEDVTEELPVDNTIPSSNYHAIEDISSHDRKQIPFHAQDLGFSTPHTNNVKKLSLESFPQGKQRWSIAGRIMRCIRRRSITQIIEQKYHIPQGLLLAMMAQEGLGDPTMPNLSGDGGLGLIHIQAANARKYGMKTLPTFTSHMIDRKHGKLIEQMLERNKSDMFSLIQENKDDRFHPICAIERSGAFLLGDYKDKRGKQKYMRLFDASHDDQRVDALKIYSGRPFSGRGGYGSKVFQYWYFICKQCGYPEPHFRSKTYKNARQKYDKRPKTTAIIKKEISKASIIAHMNNGAKKKLDYGGYVDHFDDICQDLGLDQVVSQL